MLRNAVWVAVLGCSLLASCAPAPREPVQGTQGKPPAGFDSAYYEQAAAQGRAVFRIDPGLSLVTIEVRRGGALSRFGHDHVVASRGVEGYASPQDGRADLYVALDALSVDEPDLRAEAKLDTQPSESDIAGTRANMLEKVLESDKFPHALIRVDRMTASASGATLRVNLTLHGVTREFTVPAVIRTTDGSMNVSGRLAFAQSDFGITPFSILGGAIQVQDRVELRFRVSAVPASPSVNSRGFR